jgi:transposase
MESTIEERITKAISAAVETAVQPLCAEIERKDVEIRRLKSIIDKDSSNSGKPPSSDGYKKIPNNREASGKKCGGQAGHKGSKLTIPPNLDELVREEKAEHKIVDMTNGSAKYISKWSIDIKTKVIYTEYRCPMTEPPIVYYGNDMKAYATLLMNEGFMSLDKVSSFLREITYGQISPSVATLEKFTREAASKVDVEGLKNDILNGEVMNVDESPMKSTERLLDGVIETSDKTTFDAIIRTHSNATTTLYTVNPRKDDEGIVNDGIIPLFHGIFSHDHDRKYYKYGSPELHATCHAHLSRELKGLNDLYNISWAADFRAFINEMNAYKQSTQECSDGKFAEFEQRYDDLVANGAKILDSFPNIFGRDELRKVINRLTDYKQNYLLFIKDYKAPFTNNLAERDLRPCKTKQKISGCFRSWDGLFNFAKIRSLISTAKQRSLNLFVTVARLFPQKFSSPAEL